MADTYKEKYNRKATRKEHRLRELRDAYVDELIKQGMDVWPAVHKAQRKYPYADAMNDVPKHLKHRYQINYSSAPRWHRNMFMTRPERQKTRIILQKTKTMNDDALDSIAKPLARKPFVYYW
jgi:hypothetical protein